MIADDGSVIHDVRLEHPVARVWTAITDRDALAAWLMPNDFEARVGHTFQLDARPSRGFIDAEVLELDPPHRIRWRWMIDDTPTTVTITLRTDGEGTLLHLEHTDLPPDPQPSFDGGWAEKLRDLASLLKGAS